jgi:hypothetical protein
MTAAPARANAITEARPMPEPASVTIATLLCNGLVKIARLQVIFRCLSGWKRVALLITWAQLLLMHRLRQIESSRSITQQGYTIDVGLSVCLP